VDQRHGTSPADHQVVTCLLIEGPPSKRTPVSALWKSKWRLHGIRTPNWGGILFGNHLLLETQARAGVRLAALPALTKHESGRTHPQQKSACILAGIIYSSRANFES
jgi:hypothetical protein